MSKELSLIFHSMEYGSIPEDNKIAKVWLTEHDMKFGSFVGNKYIVNETDYKFGLKSSSLDLTVKFYFDKDEQYKLFSGTQEAFTDWSSKSCHIKSRHLYGIARQMQKHTKLIATVGTLFGMRYAKDFVARLVHHFYYYAGWTQLMDVELQEMKPHGVVYIEDECNHLFATFATFAFKMCSAIAAGNTVIVSSCNPLAYLLAEICAKSGLPAGIVNVIPYHLNIINQYINSAKLLKYNDYADVPSQLHSKGQKVSIEFVGQLAIVVYENSDIESAVEGIVDSLWEKGGFVTLTGPTILLQQTIYEDVITKIKLRMTNLCAENFKDKNWEFICEKTCGCMISRSNLMSAAKNFEKAAENIGAEVFKNCDDKPGFLSPTLITRLQTSSPIDLKNVPWPVMVAIPFRTSKEAINICNNSLNGFDVSIFTEKLPLAIETAKSIKADTAWINCSKMFDATAGISDLRERYLGSTGGKEGLYEFMKPKWQVGEKKKSEGNLTSCDIIYSLESLSAKRIIKLQDSAKVSDIDSTFKLYYGGGQKRPDLGYYRTINDENGARIAEVPESNRKDVRNAVEAAQKAQPSWEKRSNFNRAQILYYLAENLDQRKEEMISHLTKYCNTPKLMAEKEVQTAIERLFYWAAFADKYGGSVQETVMQGMVVRLHEARGVIGIICPEDAPLLAFVSSFAPAVARGNSTIIVPSEKYPTPALKFYQILETSDVPGGVINILSGSSNHLYKQLTDHEDIQTIWYFGESQEFDMGLVDSRLKRYWNDGYTRDWFDSQQGQGYEFLYHCTHFKHVWMPMGETFAN